MLYISVVARKYEPRLQKKTRTLYVVFFGAKPVLPVKPDLPEFPRPFLISRFGHYATTDPSEPNRFKFPSLPP